MTQPSLYTTTTLPVFLSTQATLPDSELPLPPADLIHEVGAILARTAQAADDAAAANALNKAVYHFQKGVRPSLSNGDWLIPSASEGGTIYRISALGCSCQAGAKGKGCWHQSLIEIVMTAYERLHQEDLEMHPADDPTIALNVDDWY